MGKEYTTDEQRLYAALLDKGMKIGLAILVATFGLYVFGVLEPVIPVNDLPKYWGMSVHDYLAATGIGTGWSWASRLGQGDLLNFAGVAFLAAVTIVCYMAIIPTLLRKKDMPYVVLAVVEVAVLVLAASGLLKAGH
jgi:uncharacterized membrane protein